MNCREFGAEHEKTVLLLHGGGLSWWNYREAAALLSDEYRVILPILDGHAGSDRHFTTVEDNASEIISFIDARLGGDVALIGGLSLGGQVLLEILARRPDICRCALVESAMALPAKLTHAMVGPAFGASYGLMRSERFARLQFRSLHMPQDLFGDYFRDTCAIVKQDMIAFMRASTGYALKPQLSQCRARVGIYAGGRETRGILRSARAVCRACPDARLEILPELYHGEFSMAHAQRYAGAVRALLEEPAKDALQNGCSA